MESLTTPSTHRKTSENPQVKAQGKSQAERGSFPNVRWNARIDIDIDIDLVLYPTLHLPYPILPKMPSQEWKAGQKQSK